MRFVRHICLAVAITVVVAGCGGSNRPDGPPEMLFVSTRDGDYALFGMTSAGKDQYRITDEKGDPSSPAGLFFQVEPAWSPDAEQVAFVSGRDGKGHLYLMGIDGSDVRRLTATKQNDGHPTWSPDGKRIVFGREGALFETTPAGAPATRVGKGLGSAADPAFSPDGKLIAYDYRIPGYQTREVYVMNADGTGARAVTKLSAQSGLPAWSPDGKRLLFQSNVRDQHYDIYSIGIDGKNLRRETDSTTDAIQPQSSPDGTAIAFTRDGSIWVKHAETETRLTSGADNDSSPLWRPTTEGGS